MARSRKKLVAPIVLVILGVAVIGVEICHRKMQASLKELRDTNDAGA